ncbi:MAG: aminopeptidase P family protein [Planctomycetia bacterium]|nr:aminopeptidase P family protein [Planctomycetia bacterium]
MTNYDTSVEHCRGRQRRLLEVMRHKGLDLAIVAKIEHVQWLAGPRFAWTFEPAAALGIDGHLTLISPRKVSEPVAADEVAVYSSHRHCTLRNDQRQSCVETLMAALEGRPKPRRVGVEFSCHSPHLAARLNAETIDIEPDVYYLRRRKDPDELARLKKAIAGTGAMYARAREIIEPGITEIEVFNQLQAAAVREFGEMLTGTGNDYQCGSPGGPPRDRRAVAGELFVLDLGPAFRGYFADNCRTIACDGRATDVQLRAWQKIVEVFSIVERRAKPGASCRALFEEVQTHLDEYRPAAFNHHLGHGIGLFPHEAPHLNPHWDDTFELGDVFTAEPGLYGPELRAGIRIENDYRVTETGVELLSDFPLEL